MCRRSNFAVSFPLLGDPAGVKVFCWVLVILGGLLLTPALFAEERSATDFFERSIRPLLAEHCWNCHGPKKQQGGLRLDSREAMLRGADRGPVLVPGAAHQSLLIQVLDHQQPLKMPPKGPIPRPAIDALTRWVQAGAPWPETKVADPPVTNPDARKRHWAFQPVRSPPIPQVRSMAALGPIDRFLLHRLEARGLDFAPAAERQVWLRRVTFGLIGLPPTPEEIADFENDSSPNAFEKVVDRLLARPEYGERWARYWLDIARFADTKGYVFFQSDQLPWAWTYRDYVIRSFNEDKPYDRFILEQLAADKLDLGEDRRPLTALGFLTVGDRFIGNLHDIIDDRIDVVTRGLLGLTVSCARCHDHKFDPIPSKDYYALYGVFASCEETPIPPLFEPPPRTEEYARFEQELNDRQAKLDSFLRGKHRDLILGARHRVAEYLLAAHAARQQPTTEDFMLLADGNDLNPMMILRWKVYLERQRKTAHPVWSLWHRFADLPEANFASQVSSILAMLDPAWASPMRINPLLAEAFRQGPAPQSLGDVARRYAEVLLNVEREWVFQNFGLPPNLRPTRMSDPAKEELRQVFHGPDSPAVLPLHEIQELDLLPDRPSQGILDKLRKEVESWRATGPSAPPRAMTLSDLPKPYSPRVFVRGNPNNLGEAVSRRFLSALGGSDARPFVDGSGRLELARHIVDPNNPLTARVLVNRIWAQHFGRGLVPTLGDFGLRSEPPSHPELLDYLADHFMRQGWSIKRLHREIVLSAAYRQSSKISPQAKRLDPDNVLLSRMPRRRLDWEATRDALLAVSHRYQPRIGGPSSRQLFAGGPQRRTLYGYLDRQKVPELYRTFDFPSPDTCNPQRSETTVAPQALFLMNHPFVSECATQTVHRRDVAAITEVESRVRYLYRLLFGRRAQPAEVSLAQAFLGEKPTPALWAEYVHGLLMSNAFVFID